MSRSGADGEHGFFQRFVHSEVAGSVVLLACTLLALGWANSAWADRYFELAHSYLGISWGGVAIKLSLQHWVNDALMVVFFFVVGLEIKRELVLGELSSLRQAILPVSAAVGGMAVPALVYWQLNPAGAGAAGWGVPMATDIAFALGILALFGRRAPLGLKVFLTALAIADDLGAVLVIALFYTERVRPVALVVAAILLALLVLANRTRVRRVEVYAVLVLGVWAAVFASGVHATVAGILVALAVPVRARIEPRRFLEAAEENLAVLRRREVTRESVVEDGEQFQAFDRLTHAAGDMRPPGLVLERYLHPVQAFLILPLFALFNAGVALQAETFTLPPSAVTLGIVLGLVVGKQAGILSCSWVAVRWLGARLPPGVGWGQIWGASSLAGVGFTMSLFISELAFSDPDLVAEAKVGILVASLLAGVWGYLLLARALPRPSGQVPAAR